MMRKVRYFRQIVKLARLQIVFAVIPCFLAGTLFALSTGTAFSLLRFLWGFSILLCIEIAASFANDYYDYDADKHNKQFGFSGGSGVLLAYPELRVHAKYSAIMLNIFAIGLTGVFVWSLQLPVWVIGYIMIAVFFCWFYTAPPLRLVYRGWGEILHLLAGIMFPGWGYIILTGTLDYSILLFSVPFGLIGFTVILNFEIPDREADILGCKHNFVVRYTRESAFILVTSLYFLSGFVFALFAYTNVLAPSLNFIVPAVLCFIPFVISLQPVFKKEMHKEAATMYAIRNAIAGFCAVLLISSYLFLRLVL